MASVLIIILNWNCADDTIKAIESVYASHTEPDVYDIFLVDNGSKNEDVVKLRQFFDRKGYDVLEINDTHTQIAEKGTKKIFYYQNPVNSGFTGGNNIGMKFALKNNYDYVFLLNADATVEKNTLRMLVEKCEGDKSIGVAGPKVYFFDFHGRKDIVSFGGGSVNFWKGHGFPEGGFPDNEREWQECQTDYIEGSVMLIRAKCLKDCGFFDERFFAYWEDSDFCVRAKKHGYKVMFFPQIIARHRGSMGAYDFYYYSPHKIQLLNQNRLFFIQKNANWYHKLFFVFYFPYLFCAQIFLRAIHRRDMKYLKKITLAVIKGFIGYVRLRG